MMTGLAHARGDLVFLIDSDLEEDPSCSAALPRRAATPARPTSSTACSANGAAAWFERWSGRLFFSDLQPAVGRTRFPRTS